MKPRHLDKMRSRRSDAAARRSKLRPAPEESLTRAMCVWSWKKRSTGLVLHFAQEGIGGSRAISNTMGAACAFGFLSIWGEPPITRRTLTA